MSRTTQTVLTLRVKIPVPKGANGAMVMDYVRSAIASYGGRLDSQSPMFDPETRVATVSLLKKETTYA